MNQNKPIANHPLSVKDHLVSGTYFNLKYDEKYEMLVTEPQPKEEDLGSYYESDDYISHTDTKKGILPFLYQRVKKYSLRKKVALLNSFHKQPGSVLDVGAGTGDFLVTAQQAGWSVCGVEVNDAARKKALEKGIDLKESLATISDDKFDVITLWHVLEHISNLKDTIQTLTDLLSDNGTLLIAVPNYRSFDATHYKEFWAAYDVPRHLWHFSRNSLQLLFGSSMKLVKTKPMIFDAFYVSLLSEKYKKGKKFSLKAFWVGLQSNLKANRTKEYSSLIYCFKKAK